MGCGTYIGLGLSALGTGAQMASRAQEKGAMEDAVKAQMAKQKQYQQEAASVYQKNLQRQGEAPATANVQKGANQALQRYQQVQNVPLSLGAVNAPKITTQADKGVTTARQGMSNEQQAALQGYGDWLQGLQLGNVEAGRGLGLVGNMAQGWANLLPSQLQDAQQSYAGLESLGGLMQGAGSALGMWNATQPLGASTPLSMQNPATWYDVPRMTPMTSTSLWG